MMREVGYWSVCRRYSVYAVARMTDWVCTGGGGGGWVLVGWSGLMGTGKGTKEGCKCGRGMAGFDGRRNATRAHGLWVVG